MYVFKVLKITSEVIFVRNKDQFLEIPAQYFSFPVNVGDMVEIFSNGENQYIVRPYKVEKRRDKKQVWLYFTSTLFVLILCAIGMSILFLFPLESSKSFLNLDNSGKNVNSSTKKDVSDSISESLVSSSLDSSQTQSEPSVSSTVQEQLQSAPASMDIYAIANGDYSSITGIWQNSKGQRLAFDKNGLISGGAIKSVNLHGNIAGADAGSFGISFIPKGVNDGIYERSGHPNISDLSQDRLMAGQGLVYDGSEYYYKVE